MSKIHRAPGTDIPKQSWLGWLEGMCAAVQVDIDEIETTIGLDHFLRNFQRAVNEERARLIAEGQWLLAVSLVNVRSDFQRHLLSAMISMGEQGMKDEEAKPKTTEALSRALDAEKARADLIDRLRNQPRIITPSGGH